MPELLSLSAAYPNPFASSATLTLSASRTQHVRVQALDLLGREVAVLYEGSLSAHRSQAVTFDGAGLASGLYLIKATGEAFVVTRKVALKK